MADVRVALVPQSACLPAPSPLLPVSTLNPSDLKYSENYVSWLDTDCYSTLSAVGPEKYLSSRASNTKLIIYFNINTGMISCR